VKSVSAYAIVDAETREHVGNIVANWSDNPEGSVCTATVAFFGQDASHGTAGGGGYCKLSAAISDAVSGDFHGYGEEAIEGWFKAQGFQLWKVI
jgi:hypothetical protein